MVLLREKKQVRSSFIEEILEGANQILVTEQLLRQMDDNFSLSFHHYNDIQEWLNANPEKRDATLEIKKKIRLAK